MKDKTTGNKSNGQYDNKWRSTCGSGGDRNGWRSVPGLARF